ncbi:MAG: hypothetical protein OGMRLDGQ_002522, partial [Candidatus Fervidibacter sp.]
YAQDYDERLFPVSYDDWQHYWWGFVDYANHSFALVTKIQLQKLDSFGKWVEFWRCFGSF